MLTEFGASGNDEDSLALLGFAADQADSAFQSWAYWTYKDMHDITTANSATETLYDEDGKINAAKLKALSRTYAQAIAGAPLTMSFDPRTAAFQLQYVPNATIDQIVAPTVIFLNEGIHYPRGFKVSVSPEGSAQWVHVRKNYIEVMSNGTTTPFDLVTIRIERRWW